MTYGAHAPVVGRNRLTLILLYSGLLRGPPNAGLPRQLAFASKFEHGALLSVAWSSGLISFHPFYLEDPKAA